MSLSYVTLTVDMFDGQGNFLDGGGATFTPSVQLTDATDHEIVIRVPLAVAFKSTGSPTIRLLATDNANVLPSGWAWTVTFSGVSGSPASFSFFLPFSGGAAQNLSALSPVSTAVTQFPANPMTAAGDMITGGASPAGTPQRLAVGTANEVLTVVGGLPAWAPAGAASLPLTTLGDLLYEDATPAPARLPGNTAATRKFLRQTGTGTVSAAPAWDTIQAADVPTLNQSTTGNAATATAAAGLESATTTVAVSAATAPVSGQVLTAASGTAANWQDPAVKSVAGKTGTVTLTASDVGADASGAAAAAQTAAESYADTSKLAKSANLSDLASASSARTNLGLGSAATQPSSAFDAAGAAAAAQAAAEAASLPATDDLSAIATANATAASVPMNNHKFTGLANGVASSDSAAYGQTPAGGNTVTIGQGGTGQTTQQAAVNALTGTQSAGKYLRSDGTNASLQTIQAADVPTLNQNTTGTAANLSGTPALPNGTTATTQSAADSSTKLATTAYADTSSSTAAAGKVSKSGDTMTGYLAPKAVTLTDGSSVAIDASAGNVFDWPLGGSSHTLAAPSNAVDGDMIFLRIGYSGSFTPLFNAVYDFNGSAPAWTAASGKEDEVAFRYRAASSKWRYQGSMLGFTS